MLSCFALVVSGMTMQPMDMSSVLLSAAALPGEVSGLLRGPSAVPSKPSAALLAQPVGEPALADRTRLGTLDVPQLALGTIAWTPSSAEDEARIATLAKKAADSGLDFIDTAERYGAKAADLIPAALSSVARSLGFEFDASAYQGGDCESNLAKWGRGAQVATKFTPKPERRSAQAVVDCCRESAARLGVDSIPLYQIHMPDIIQPFAALGVEDRKDELYWDGLAECFLSGLAQNVGVSNYGPTMVARAQEALARRGVPLASNQIPFSLLNRREGNLATVEACTDLGVATLAYYPLAMGLLTGKLTPSALRGRRDPRSRDLLRYLEGGNGGTAGSVPSGGVRSLQTVLHAVAARTNKTPAQVALNWVICKGAIPVAGASSATQLEENVGALNWRLSADEVRRDHGLHITYSLSASFDS
jgi:pyridoxine 4-dehydrogenase